MNTNRSSKIGDNEYAYSKIDARMIGAPEDVVVNYDEISRNGVAFIDDVLVYTFFFVHRHREGRDTADQIQKKS